MKRMFKNVLRIAVQEAFPPRTRGRPALLGFEDAYDDILRVVRTGTQWRHRLTWCRVRCAHFPVARDRSTFAGANACVADELTKTDRRVFRN